MTSLLCARDHIISLARARVAVSFERVSFHYSPPHVHVTTVFTLGVLVMFIGMMFSNKTQCNIAPCLNFEADQENTSHFLA